jgi:hypothetical protein
MNIMKKTIIVLMFTIGILNALTLEEGKENCNNGSVRDCMGLANYYQKEKDMSNTITFISKACDLGYTKACNNIGLMYYFGKKVPKNKTKSLEFFTKSCDLGNMEGCNKVGKMYFFGADEVKINKIYSRAFFDISYKHKNSTGATFILKEFNNFNLKGYVSKLKESCVNGNTRECYYYANYLHSAPGKILKKTSLDFYDKSCKNGYQNACVSMGSMYAFSKYIENDLEKATKLFEEACTQHNVLGCYNLGKVYAKKKNIKKSTDLYVSSCNNGFAGACTAYAISPGVKKKVSDIFLKIAIDGGDMTAKFMSNDVQKIIQEALKK